MVEKVDPHAQLDYPSQEGRLQGPTDIVWAVPGKRSWRALQRRVECPTQARPGVKEVCLLIRKTPGGCYGVTSMLGFT